MARQSKTSATRMRATRCGSAHRSRSALLLPHQHRVSPAIIGSPAGSTADIKTVSSEIRLDYAHLAGWATKSVSGDPTAALIAGGTDWKPMSGSRECGDVAEPLTAETLSGSIRTGLAFAAPLVCKTVTGSIEGTFTPETGVAVKARRVFGRLRSNIPLSESASAASGAMATLNRNSVSGDITVSSLASV